MEKSLDVLTGKVAVLFLLIFISFELVGCTSVGKVVPLQNRILLSDNGDEQGTYNDGELTLNYSYHQVGRRMTLDGEATSVWNFDSIDVKSAVF